MVFFLVRKGGVSLCFLRLDHFGLLTAESAVSGSCVGWGGVEVPVGVGGVATGVETGVLVEESGEVQVASGINVVIEKRGG